MKKFTFYLEDDSLKVKAGDKLQLTVTGKAPNLLMYGVNDAEDKSLLNVGPTLLSDDRNDQNYLEAEIMETLPEDITVTVLEVNTVFGVCKEVIISINELEDV